MTTLEKIKLKLFDRDSLSRRLSVWRLQSKKIVFTNGCFDLLHLGHIDYLGKAADEGDILFIGVNTDSSVAGMKKNHPPVNVAEQRTMLLASFSFVDAVVLFDEDTPLELIKFIMPDILVKGADYAVRDIAGSDVVLQGGGVVKTIELLPGYSTSLIFEKIKKG